MPDELIARLRRFHDDYFPRHQARFPGPCDLAALVRARAWRLARPWPGDGGPDLKTVDEVMNRKPNGNPEITLNFITQFYFDKRSSYFDDYARRYTDLPMLVQLKEHNLPDGSKTLVPDRYVRASDFNGKLGQTNHPEWKTVAFDEMGKSLRCKTPRPLMRSLWCWRCCAVWVAATLLPA